ncbi:meiotic recombination protein REC8 homolog isoform X2 [Rhinatrema bivittatum]|uniref:meiotic recombination protein REC8 homolog isoform X2 n=1 Tax=Rhinatrema bivittatum TaxID=194408 RepID=UPI00112D23CD|nr:meiotic recombination protein REC8 homolog isoform X2 [Rhinatrema bivittatum]
MFYYPNVLQRHTGRFATIWLAATRGTKIVKREYLKVNVAETCEEIIEYVLVRVQPPYPGGPRPRFSLYLSAQLGYGVICVYHKQCDYLIEEIKLTLDRLHRAEKHIRIDMVQPEQPGLLLPDPLSLMLMTEGALDPFFGIMDVEPDLPSPMDIPQVRSLLKTPSPEWRRLERTPPKPPPALEHLTSPEKITLREIEPIKLPEVELGRDLPEITTEELDFLMAVEPPFPMEEVPRERRIRGEPRKELPMEEESVEEVRRREMEVPVVLSPPSRIPEELRPEFDSMILLHEITGEPILVPPIPEIPAEATPAEVRMPPPPSVSVSISPKAVRAPPRSPELLLPEIFELPPAMPRRRRRQLRFIDQVLQIPQREMEEQISDVLTQCQQRVPIVLPHRQRKTPAELLNNPTYDRWIPPELHRLWARCAIVERVDYARRRAAEAEEEEEEEKQRERETISEAEVLREGLEPSVALISSEISLEVSEEEKLRVSLVTPEERRFIPEEEITLPIVQELPELAPELPWDSIEITVDAVQSPLQGSCSQPEAGGALWTHPDKAGPALLQG